MDKILKIQDKIVKARSINFGTSGRSLKGLKTAKVKRIVKTATADPLNRVRADQIPTRRRVAR